MMQQYHKNEEPVEIVEGRLLNVEIPLLGTQKFSKEMECMSSRINWYAPIKYA